MKLFRVMKFSAKLLMAYWMLDVFIAAQPPNSFIMPNTNEFFPDIIRSGEFALFLYRVLVV
jgi:hypothetical protein